MPLNIALKTAILQSGRSQKQIALRARIQESLMSRSIHGDRVFTAAERRRLFKVLQRSECELFPQQEALSA